jgi:RNA-dependent RNA polymerase
MEVFMHNMAVSVTVMDVKVALANVLHQRPFPTERIHFDVKIFKKSKGCGSLTIPLKEFGEIFLRMYGKTGIAVKGRRIMFKPSRRNVDQARVLFLLDNPWEDPAIIQEENKRRMEMSQPIPLKDFSFGRLCHDDTFLPDSYRHSGSATIVCDLQLRKIRLIISGQSMSAFYSPPQIKKVLSVERFHGVDRVFLVSDTPPTFAADNTIHPFSFNDIMSELPTSQHQMSPPNSPLSDGMPSRRRTSLGDQPMLPMCHSLSLTFNSTDGVETFLMRCKSLRLPEAMPHSDIKYKSHETADQHLAQLDTLLGKLSLQLAIDVEKAFYEGLLLPYDIISVENDLIQLSSDTRFDPPAAFRFFLTKLRLPVKSTTPRRRRRRRKGKQVDSNGKAATSLRAKLQDAIDIYLEEKNKEQPVVRASPAIYDSYHLIITPTSRILEGPLPDQSNSVLRRFKRYECFLRVSIQDEQRSKLRNDSTINVADILKERFKTPLVHGLRLAGREYQFLGYSMSGLKEHSVWFVTPFQSVDSGAEMDAETIRESLV